LKPAGPSLPITPGNTPSQDFELHQRNEFNDLPADFGPPRLQIGSGILLHRQPREQPVLLKNKPFVEPGYDAAAWPDDRYHFSFANIYIDRPKRLNRSPARMKRFGQFCNLKQRLSNVPLLLTVSKLAKRMYRYKKNRGLALLYRAVSLFVHSDLF
jgi:hypothetical protein